jgi:hypothetical protein
MALASKLNMLSTRLGQEGLPPTTRDGLHRLRVYHAPGRRRRLRRWSRDPALRPLSARTSPTDDLNCHAGLDQPKNHPQEHCGAATNLQTRCADIIRGLKWKSRHIPPASERRTAMLKLALRITGALLLFIADQLP